MVAILSLPLRGRVKGHQAGFTGITKKVRLQLCQLPILGEGRVDNFSQILALALNQLDYHVDGQLPGFSRCRYDVRYFLETEA